VLKSGFAKKRKQKIEEKQKKVGEGNNEHSKA
jgi:hypothetical protein